MASAQSVAEVRRIGMDTPAIQQQPLSGMKKRAELLWQSKSLSGPHYFLVTTKTAEFLKAIGLNKGFTQCELSRQ